MPLLFPTYDSVHSAATKISPRVEDWLRLSSDNQSPQIGEAEDLTEIECVPSETFVDVIVIDTNTLDGFLSNANKTSFKHNFDACRGIGNEDQVELGRIRVEEGKKSQTDVFNARRSVL
ncbi:hypothetical protein HYQ46_011886 [Verticillium longisporum]|nr:hypothetical protein HYQ46_011886 [Verticillium longisporum]